MLSFLGRVGGIFQKLPGASAVPAFMRQQPTSRAGRLMRGLGGIENASLGLGGLLYGSNLIQQAASNLGFMPSAADLARMQADRTRPAGTLATLNDKQVEWRGKDLGWQRTYAEGANAPPPAPDLNAGLFGGPQAGQLTPPPPRLPGTGALSNGAGVPAQRQNVLNRSLSQEVLNAAQQYAAPTNVPLSAFYEGQQQLGRSMMQQGNLVSELQRLGAAPGMAPENLKAWAQANPDLAYREFLRLKQTQ